MTNDLRPDKTWSLFLDRDGVINVEKKEDYIYNWDEFIFYEGVKAAMKIFNTIFGNIIMVTNQRGVGRGLMTETNLQDIHRRMIEEIECSGGRLDKIYYSTTTDNTDPRRKPNSGMAFEAKKDNPVINLTNAIIIGNNLSDMQFGKGAGMHTILLNTTSDAVKLPHPLVDHQFSSLLDAALFINNKKTAEIVK